MSTTLPFCEINRRFLDRVRLSYPDNNDRVIRMSIIEEGKERRVRMAYLACVGSHAINGVAALHTELLEHQLLRDFYELFPEKFSNKTNGVTPRRWLSISNPKLALQITYKIGKTWVKNLDELKQLEAFAENAEFHEQWRQIKHDNKQDLAEYIQITMGFNVNAESLFDIQVKRFHEYKRQHLNILHVITLYNHIKQHPDADVLPRTVIFAGKAAPGYKMAKLIIKLINSVADVVNHDRDLDDRLKVVFLPNYGVSLAQYVYPAADLSEQISLAGKEASGTSNMKFAMNGSLTIGTLDGANIEIRDRVGAENFFLFGMTTPEVAQLKAQGYRPQDYYQANAELKAAIDQIASGYFSKGDRELFKPLTDSLKTQDDYLLFADYQSYIDCQQHVSQVYRDTKTWTRMSILNAARIGYFSSDLAIQDYARDIWHVQPVPIQLEEDAESRVPERIGTTY